MTIAIGFRFHQGIMVSSDSQYTAGTLKMTGQKVFRAIIGEDKIIFTMAGSVPYARMAVEKIVRDIAAIPGDQRTKEKMRNSIELTVLKLHRKHIFIHPHCQQQGGPDFYLIIGTWSHIDGLDFFNQSETALMDITDYHCTGWGEDLARFVIKSLFRHKNLSLWDAENIAIHVLRETKDNVSFCGGANQFAYLTETGEMGSSFGMNTLGTEELSELFAVSISRLYLFAADVNVADKTIHDELIVVQSRLNAIRQKLRDERSQYAEVVKQLGQKSSKPDFEYP